MRIVFLDIDGVLNSVDFMMNRAEALAGRTRRRATDAIDPCAVVRLQSIIVRTGAKVVVSSTWRKSFKPYQIARILRPFGFTGEIVGATPCWWRRPDGTPSYRGDEIQGWLDGWPDGERPDVASFVILDDSDDMVHLLPRLVRTDTQSGLLDEHADRAVTMLTG